jgi:hypothetical protein
MELYENLLRVYLVNYTVLDTNTQKYHLIDVRINEYHLSSAEYIQLSTPNGNEKLIAVKALGKGNVIYKHVPEFIQEIENTTADNIIITNFQKLNL